MVGEGNGATGRALVDSLLRQTPEGSAAYGNALYWRGALAETAAEAERDYRRVIVEYPVSAYVDDALLALVELEQARGDRAGALQHLQRFVREHQAGSQRGVAALSAARLAFDQRDVKTGCSMLGEARASLTSADVEARNQIDYLSGRCSTAELSASAAGSTAAIPVTPSLVGRDTAPAPAKSVPQATPSAPVITKTPANTAATKPVPAPEKSIAEESRGVHTIQIAAYNTLADAERLVAKLVKQGVHARVSGTTKPFRVRLDFYATRQAAQDEVVSLKKRGVIGFVTTEGAVPEKKTP